MIQNDLLRIYLTALEELKYITPIKTLADRKEATEVITAKVETTIVNTEYDIPLEITEVIESIVLSDLNKKIFTETCREYFRLNMEPHHFKTLYIKTKQKFTINVNRKIDY